MHKKLVLTVVFLTIFLDFFNLGLIYPIFTSLIFEGNGEFITTNSSDFFKNSVFGLLIAAFPFGQFIGAPIIGQLSDQYGRRKLLTLSLIGTALTLFICALGVLFSSLIFLLLGRLTGGLMAGNMTLAYASLADFSTTENKVRNFALIPLATGLGFALGPYLAGILANPDTHAWAGPALPFLVAVLFALINLALCIWKFPETLTRKTYSFSLNTYLMGFKKLSRALKNWALLPYLGILFLMLSSNLVFIQFLGPFAIDRFKINVTEVGYLYANVGFAVAIGHLFLTRTLAKAVSSEKALVGSLVSLGILLIALVFSNSLLMLHLLAFVVMLACAVAYTNSMALISNQACKDTQGEIMGVAVSVQSCAEFLPAAILGFVAFISQAIPISVAAICAFAAYFILYRKCFKKLDSQTT